MFDTHEYFDGNVTSIAFKTATLPATIGVMAVGDYVFNTNEKETMTVVSGSLTIQLNKDTDEICYNAGESFDVPANSSFTVKVSVETAYLCLYG